MRHFFYVDVNGELLSTSTCRGGFSDDHDLTDPGCKHPVVAAIQAHANKVPSFDRFVDYVCGCPGHDDDCPCPYNRLLDSYAEGAVLVTKPTLTQVIDGSSFTVTPPVLSRAPGSSVTLKLQASVADGHQVEVSPVGSASVLAAPTTLTFNGGETETINLVVPALGMTGGVIGRSKYVRQFAAQLKGA